MGVHVVRYDEADPLLIHVQRLCPAFGEGRCRVRTHEVQPPRPRRRSYRVYIASDDSDQFPAICQLYPSPNERKSMTGPTPKTPTTGVQNRLAAGTADLVAWNR
jgi:hypothetical protein